MPVTWDPSLTVGFDEIDAQHQELFRRASALLEDIGRGRADGELTRLLDFLAAYVREHFGAEEGLMLASGYPLVGPHRAQHRAFVQSFVERKGELEREGPSPELAARLSDFLSGWLRDHIGSADRALGKFLIESGVAAAAREQDQRRSP